MPQSAPGIAIRTWLVIELLPGYAPELTPVELHVNTVNAFSSVHATSAHIGTTQPSTAPPADALAITLDREPSALLSNRNRPRTAMQGCVRRALCAGDARKPAAIKETNECASAGQTGVVGLAGLEPAASSLSGIEG